MLQCSIQLTPSFTILTRLDGEVLARVTEGWPGTNGEVLARVTEGWPGTTTAWPYCYLDSG